MKKLITALSVLAVGMLCAPAARAENFSLHLEGGAAGDVGASSSNVRVGMGGNGKLLFPVFSPNLAVGPSVSVLSFENRKDNSENANLWQFGATLRLQGKHSASTGMYPWVDASAGVDKQASLYRPGLSAALGLEAFLDRSHTFSMGPWIGYQHTFDNTYQQSTLLLPHRDLNAVLVGFSLSFDGAPKPVHTVETRTAVKEVKTIEMRMQLIPVLVEQEPTLIQVDGTVAFEKDSAKLTDEGKKLLNNGSEILKRRPELSVDVMGHASSEGDVNHNWQLARVRAETAVNYLVSQGVDRARLAPASYGPTGGNTDKDLKDNRRVEFIIHVNPTK